MVAQLVKNPSAMQETLVLFRIRKTHWRRERLPTPVFWLGEFPGLYGPWGHKESDTMEPLSLSFRIKIVWLTPSPPNSYSFPFLSPSRSAKPSSKPILRSSG